MDPARFDGLIDGRDEGLSGRGGCCFVAGGDCRAHFLQVVFHRRRSPAVCKGTGNSLAGAFRCGFGVGHKNSVDFCLLKGREKGCEGSVQTLVVN